MPRFIFLFLLLFGLLGARAELPTFEYQRLAIDPAATEWPQDKDLIAPMVIDATKYFEEPLGRYYLYCGPHDHKPGNGIGLYYADSLDGPWTLHGQVVGDKMSSVAVIWNDEKEELYLFGHLPPHSRNFFYTSKDGIQFGEKTNAKIASHGYGKAYRYTLPGHDNKYIFIGWNGGVFGKWQKATPQRFMSGLWKSDDLENWELVDHFKFKPEEGGHLNCGSPFLFQYQDRNYMLFHGQRPGSKHTPPFDGAEIWAYEVDASLNVLKYLGTVLSFEEGDPGHAARVGSPFIIEGDDGALYLFVNNGKRLGQRIAYAKALPEPKK